MKSSYIFLCFIFIIFHNYISINNYLVCCQNKYWVLIILLVDNQQPKFFDYFNLNVSVGYYNGFTSKLYNLPYHLFGY